MILTVTANPALDVTYHVDAMVPGAVHRVRCIDERPGGKGVNVARVLRAVGDEACATGLSGGRGGAVLTAALAGEGVLVEMVDALPDVRRTVVVHAADGSTTSFWEAGRAPADPAAAADLLQARVTDRLPRVRALCVCGSLPPGIDPVLPARLAALAGDAGVPAVLDLDGAALSAAVAAGGAVVMPNVDELETLLGRRPGSVREVVQECRDLVAAGVPAVVATLGHQGLVAVSPAGAVHGRLPTAVAGNATGAGDAACAAVARALARAGAIEAVDLRVLALEAVALSAAAVLRPTAGEVDVGAYRGWRPQVVLEDV